MAATWTGAAWLPDPGTTWDSCSWHASLCQPLPACPAGPPCRPHKHTHSPAHMCSTDRHPLLFQLTAVAASLLTIFSFIAGPSNSRPSVKKCLYISSSLISPRSNLIQVCGCLTAKSWPSMPLSRLPGGPAGARLRTRPGSDLFKGHAQSLWTVREEGVLDHGILQVGLTSLMDGPSKQCRPACIMVWIACSLIPQIFMTGLPGMRTMTSNSKTCLGTICGSDFSTEPRASVLRGRCGCCDSAAGCVLHTLVTAAGALQAGLQTEYMPTGKHACPEEHCKWLCLHATPGSMQACVRVTSLIIQPRGLAGEPLLCNGLWKQC